MGPPVVIQLTASPSNNLLIVLMGFFRSSNQGLISALDRSGGQHTFLNFVVLKI